MSDARDKARGQTSRSRTQRSQRTVRSGSPHGGGNKVTSNKKKIDQNIKVKQDINKGTRTSSFDTQVGSPPPINRDDEKDDSGIDIAAIQAANKARNDAAYQASLTQQQQVRDSLKLSQALQSSGVDKSQWQRMMDKGSLSPEVALQMGLATQSPDGRIIDPATGQGWVPKGKLSEDMITGMKDLQFMQDEGVYGGTFGLEKEVNKTKGEIQNIAQDIINKNPNISTEDLKAKIEATSEAQGLASLWGGDMSSALMNTFGMQDPDFGSKKAWEATIPGTDTYISAGDVGYDPTAAYTFSEIEDSAKYGKNDPRNLYQNKFLQRGTLWDDPLSGTLSPGKSIATDSGPGGGWGGGYGGGGGGGDGYGFSGFGQDQMPQGYQRGQVGPGSLQEQVNQMYLGMSGAGMQKKRGGIVSLLGL